MRFAAPATLLFLTLQQGLGEACAQVSRSLIDARSEIARLAPPTPPAYAPICDLPCIPGTPRSSAAWAAIDQTIYLAGGHKGMEHTYSPPQFAAEFHAFDLKSQRWTRLENRPFAAQGYSLAGTKDAAGRSILAAFGGFVYSDIFKPGYRSLSAVDLYDASRDAWTTSRSAMPVRRSSHGMAVVGGCAVLVGGWNATPRWEDDRGGQFQVPIAVVDIASGSATSVYVIKPAEVDLLTRRAFGYAQQGDTLYVAGGLGVGGELDVKSSVAAIKFTKVACNGGYPPAEYTVNAMPALPHGLFAPGLGVAPNGALYAFGGGYYADPADPLSFAYTDEVWRLDPGANAWVRNAVSMKEAKSFVGVLAVRPDKFLLIGGHLSSGSYNGPTSSMELFSIP